MHTLRKLLVWVCVAVATSAGAQGTASTPPHGGCASAPSRAFDFWIGEWAVTNPAGATVGHSRIESILDGCALAEHWTGAGGGVGVSYNAYDAAAKVWRQFWIDAKGNVLRLAGNFVDGRMVLRSEPGKHIDRISWTPGAGSVRQVWEVSEDGGAHWATSFDGMYRKAR